jgi:hypothetical protein
LDEPKFLERLPTSLELIATKKISSLYYVISRVFNAKLMPEGQSPDYLADINKISSALPSIGDYGPHKLFVLKKNTRDQTHVAVLKIKVTKFIIIK